MKTGNLILSAFVAALVAAGVTFAMNHYEIGVASPAHAASLEAVADVPGLIGLGTEQARSLLESHGLLLSLVEERDNTQIDPGKICEQSPLEGSRVRRGETVSAVISRSPETVAVPNLIGISSAKAKELLLQANLLPGSLNYRSSDNAGEGAVLDQTPSAGQTARKGTKVDLVVNRID